MRDILSETGSLDHPYFTVNDVDIRIYNIVWNSYIILIYDTKFTLFCLFFLFVGSFIDYCSRKIK